MTRMPAVCCTAPTAGRRVFRISGARVLADSHQYLTEEMTDVIGRKSCQLSRVGRRVLGSLSVNVSPVRRCVPVDINEEGAQRAANELVAAGGKAIGCAVDVSNRAQDRSRN